MQNVIATALFASAMATGAFAQSSNAADMMNDAQTALDQAQIDVDVPATATEDQLAEVIAYVQGLSSTSSESDRDSTELQVREILGIETTGYSQSANEMDMMDEAETALQMAQIDVDIPATATEEQLAAIIAYTQGLGNDKTNAGTEARAFEVKQILGIETTEYSEATNAADMMNDAQTALDQAQIDVDVPASATTDQLAQVIAYVQGLSSGGDAPDAPAKEFQVKQILGL